MQVWKFRVWASVARTTVFLKLPTYPVLFRETVSTHYWLWLIPWGWGQSLSYSRIPNILRKPKVLYPVYKRPPLVPVLSQMNIIVPPTSRFSEWSLPFCLSALPLYSSLPICVLHAQSISSFFTWSFWLYLAKSISYEAPHYALFSNFVSSYHPLRSKYSFLRPVLKHPQSLKSTIFWDIMPCSPLRISWCFVDVHTKHNLTFNGLHGVNGENLTSYPQSLFLP
jgi:hypothetical protein